MASSFIRSEKLDLRISSEAKKTLQAAARSQSRSLSEFVLESALRRAAETLPDRQRFGIGEEGWRLFLAALEARPQPLPRMKKLLRSRGPFDAAPQ